MGTATPNYTEQATALLALQTLAAQAVVSATYDLRAKFGAWLYVQDGIQGTTAPTVGLGWLIRRTFSNGAVELAYGPTFVGGTTACVRTTCAASGNTAGQNLLDVASTTSFAAGDSILIDDTGNVGIGNSEFARVSLVVSSTRLQLDRPMQFAHASASAHVSNKANLYPGVWMDGGTVVEVIADYGQSGSSASTAVVRSVITTLDSITD